jgi:hypothetical protein
LFYIFYTFTDHFVPKSCVQGLSVAAEKERKKEQKKTEEVSVVQKKSCY